MKKIKVFQRIILANLLLTITILGLFRFGIVKIDDFVPILQVSNLLMLATVFTAIIIYGREKVIIKKGKNNPGSYLDEIYLEEDSD